MILIDAIPYEYPEVSATSPTAWNLIDNYRSYRSLKIKGLVPKSPTNRFYGSSGASEGRGL
eukprot:scaffold431309_cov17-Prasinocladus_malaysianus.AAC.1